MSPSSPPFHSSLSFRESAQVLDECDGNATEAIGKLMSYRITEESRNGTMAVEPMAILVRSSFEVINEKDEHDRGTEQAYNGQPLLDHRHCQPKPEL